MSHTTLRGGLKEFKSILELWDRKKWKLTFMYVAPVWSVPVVGALALLACVLRAFAQRGVRRARAQARSLPTKR